MSFKKQRSLVYVGILLAAPLHQCRSEFVVTFTDTQATKTGLAQGTNFSQLDEYPRIGDNGIDIGTTSAGTSDGAADTASVEVFNLDVTSSATASGSSSANTPGPVGSLVGALQAISASGVAGAASVQATPPGHQDPTLPHISDDFGARYTSTHTATATARGIAVNNGPGGLRLVGMVYAAVQGGCSAVGDNGCVGGTATARVENRQFMAGFGPNQSLTVFETFDVTGTDNITGVTVFADAVSTNNGNVLIHEAGSETVTSTSVSVAAAYSWLVPFNPPAPVNANVATAIASGLTQGDVTFDNLLNADDIDAIAAEARDLQGSSATDPFSVFSGAEPIFDQNFDLRVTYEVSAAGQVTSDSDFLIRTLLGTEYGDIDLDGDVDLNDFGVFSSHYDTAVTGWEQGDFNGDGFNNLLDFSILGEYYGFGTGSSTSIPEPTTVALLIPIAALVSTRRLTRA